MKKTNFFYVFLIAGSLLACSEVTKETDKQDKQAVLEPSNTVKLSTEIDWEALNPARGDQSPQAGTIWGDRNGTVATGFLAKFVDGFSSPPHIHNVTYRALVLKGLIHNDDPSAAKMWMSEGSFWTQPAGEPHITAAKGEENIAYVEIDHGPYLVKPTEEAFDSGERPVNLDQRNIVWLDDSETFLINKYDGQNAVKSAKIAFLWENNDMSGKLLKIPAGFKGEIISTGKILHAVIISGSSNYEMPDTKEVKFLDPGSYFNSAGNSIHAISTKVGQECIIYIRTNGEISIKPLR